MTGRPRGIAFANCIDEETVKKLTDPETKIKINDQEINIMENEMNAKKDELFKVFISNLPQSTTEEKFKTKIQEVMTEDEIESITFPLDKDESKSRGFAFIILKNNESMKKLLALDQKLELDNCELNIRVCHEANSDGRGRGSKRGFKSRGGGGFYGGGRGRGGGGFYGGRGGGGGFRRGYSDWYGGPGGPRNFRGGSRGGWKRGGGGYGGGGGGGYGGGGGGGRYGNMTWF
nr:nucleolin [Bemisia tabaci]